MANAIEIKQKNRNNIFRYIYQEKKISKLEIARGLGLSMPTITQNLAELFERNLIYVHGTFESTGGRKAKAICCNMNAKYAIGIDITKNHISGVLVNLAGELIYSLRLRMRFEPTEAYYQKLSSLVDHVAESGKVSPEMILGVGISIPAIIDKDNRTIHYAPIVDVRTIYEDLRNRLSYPYAIFNDSKAGGYAELWHAKHVENMVYLSLSNSVGGAVLMNNEIYYGEQRFSGEVGHMTLEIDGRPCYCGKKGCVDAYCNAQNLSNHTDGDLKRFFELLEAGDEECAAEWQQYIHYLSVVINNLNNMLNCDVILGGYVGGFMEKHIGELRRLVVERSTFETDGSFIKTCFFKYESSAVGAALYFIDEFINAI